MYSFVKEHIIDSTFESNYYGLTKPTQNIEGRNWTVFSCFKRILRYPLDGIMYIINQYLNWHPAGCWNKLTKVNCIVCGITTRYFMLRRIFCSLDCRETYCRKEIEYQQSKVTAIIPFSNKCTFTESFMQRPEIVTNFLERILDYEDEDEDAWNQEGWHSQSSCQCYHCSGILDDDKLYQLSDNNIYTFKDLYTKDIIIKEKNHKNDKIKKYKKTKKVNRTKNKKYNYI